MVGPNNDTSRYVLFYGIVVPFTYDAAYGIILINSISRQLVLLPELLYYFAYYTEGRPSGNICRSPQSIIIFCIPTDDKTCG